MVASKQRFLIDSTFIFENTHKAFLGSPLFLKKGQDRTFLFGFLIKGKGLIGKENNSLTCDSDKSLE